MGENHCAGFSEAALERISAAPGIRTVVLTFMSTYLSDSVFAADHLARGVPTATLSSERFREASKQELFFRGLDAFVTRVESRGIEVVIFTAIPELPFFPRDCIRRSRGAFSSPLACRLSRADVLARQAPYRDVLERVKKAHPKLRAFETIEFFCRGEECSFRDETRVLYLDSHHLTIHGSHRLAAALLEWLRAPQDAQATESAR